MAVILIGHQLFAKTVNYRSVYKFVVLVMAGSFMLLPVFIGAALAESIIGLVGYLSMNVLIWLMLAELCYTYRLSPVKVFGIGWGMITLGVLVGQLFAGWLVKTVTFTPQLVSLAVLICTLAVLVSEMFVLQEDDIIEMTKITEEAPAEPVRTPFKDRCREVAEEYGLTPRETEVMILFAKGRSSARIQEDLVLSRGTVTTHLQRIYQKMGVHSKQEFLDLIDNH